MRFVTIFALLTLMWMALVEDVSLKSLTFGIALSAVVILSMRRIVAHRMFMRQHVRMGSLIHILQYFLYLGVGMVRANLRVSRMVLSPRLRLRPAVLAVTTETMGDLEDTALANSVSLLPGTLSLDFSEDRRVIYVHFLHLEGSLDQARQSVKEFEHYVIEAL